MSATAGSPEAAAQLLFQPNVQYNNSRLYTIKFLSSCFAGAVAGVLGLENTLGFALFIFSTLLTSSCLYLKCKGRPGKYVSGGWWEVVNPGQENIFSFVLVWTLFYGTPITRIFLCSRWEQSVGFGATQGLCTVRSQHVMGSIRQISMESCSQSTIESWEDGRRSLLSGSLDSVRRCRWRSGKHTSGPAVCTR